MKQLKTYTATFYSCCIASAIQALGINILPLLFVSLQNEFSLSLSKLTFLITLMFLVQLLMDALSAKIMDRIGYKTAMITAHIFTMAGLILMSVLPRLLANAYIGLLIATIICAIGCGILEVIVSPTVEAIPDKKNANLTLLHSFYSFGYIFVVLASVIYFLIFDRQDWIYLPLLLAIVPLFNGIFFIFVPCTSLDEQRGQSYSLKELLTSKKFYLFLVLIICAGASEQAMSQWISYFAEKGLNISKTTGDIIGPLVFAVLMAMGRFLYGLFGHKFNIRLALPISGIACFATYLVAIISSNAIISLVACAITGLCISIMWPSTLDIASKNILRGGTAMFALLALGGDIGCTLGPSIVGFVSDASSYELKGGLAVAIIFPVIFFVASMIYSLQVSKHDDYKNLQNKLNSN